MDFRLTAAEEAFRKEVADWLDTNVPADFDPERFEFGMTADERLDWQLAWHRKLHAGGWVGLHWPREYGRGASLMEQVIFREARAARLPPGANRSASSSSADAHALGNRGAGGALPKISADEMRARLLEPAPAPTSRRSRRARSRTATSSSRTGRRSGRARRAPTCILRAHGPHAPRHQDLVPRRQRTPGITVRPLVR
jgi:alkylation response protein AidB-like acyl-CoA dehydrogenase